MYVVTNKEDNFVLDVSENISYDVFGNILFHNKAIYSLSSFKKFGIGQNFKILL